MLLICNVAKCPRWNGLRRKFYPDNQSVGRTTAAKWGSGGRRFKSSRPDQYIKSKTWRMMRCKKWRVDNPRATLKSRQVLWYASELNDGVDDACSDQEAMMAKAKVTSAGRAASLTLRSSSTGSKSKSSAGNALSQRKASAEVTSPKVASAASSALQHRGTSKPSKSAAGSALSQRPASKPKK